jgi:hypothetical protein
MTREEEIKRAASEVAKGSLYPTLTKRDFVEGAEWADAHPHWISVEDEKPPYDESVLLYGKVFDYVVIGELLEEYGRDIYYDDDGNPYHYESITHWMPLPAKPKGGEE